MGEEHDQRRWVQLSLPLRIIIIKKNPKSKHSSWMGPTWMRRYSSGSRQQLFVGFHPHGNLSAARVAVCGEVRCLALYAWFSSPPLSKRGFVCGWFTCQGLRPPSGTRLSGGWEARNALLALLLLVDKVPRKCARAPSWPSSSSLSTSSSSCFFIESFQYFLRQSSFCGGSNTLLKTRLLQMSPHPLNWLRSTSKPFYSTFVPPNTQQQQPNKPSELHLPIFTHSCIFPFFVLHRSPPLTAPVSFSYLRVGPALCRRG